MFKKPISLLIILFAYSCFSQQSLHKEFPFFEQIAFDFYSNTIIDSFPSKKKIRVSMYTFNLHPFNHAFNSPFCRSDTYLKENKECVKIVEYEKSLIDIDSKRLELDFTKTDLKKFKIKKSVNKHYPRLFITLPYTLKGNYKYFLINVYEETSKTKTIIYHLKLDLNGNVTNWLRKELKTYIEY